MAGKRRNYQQGKKSVRPTTREMNGAIFMLRCAELGLTTDEELNAFTVGMIYDLMTEKANDSEKYPYKATEADINAFFG